MKLNWSLYEVLRFYAHIYNLRIKTLFIPIMYINLIVILNLMTNESNVIVNLMIKPINEDKSH